MRRTAVRRGLGLLAAVPLVLTACTAGEDEPLVDPTVVDQTGTTESDGDERVDPVTSPGSPDASAPTSTTGPGTDDESDAEDEPDPGPTGPDADDASDAEDEPDTGTPPDSPSEGPTPTTPAPPADGTVPPADPAPSGQGGQGQGGREQELLARMQRGVASSEEIAELELLMLERLRGGG